MLKLLHIPKGMYRNIGIFEQFPVYNKEDIYKVIEKHNGFRHIGISMCAYLNGEQHLLYLPFDFDDENDLTNPWYDAKNLFNKCVDEGYESYLSYSGRRGFHIYIETEPKIYTHNQISKSQSYFIDELNLKTFDYKIHGDISRLMRIPWTLNLNGGMCRILAYNKGKKLDLDTIHYERKIESERHSDGDYGDKEFYRPCVDWLISGKSRDWWMKRRGKYEPEEPVRLTWASMRLWRGDSIEEIIEEAKSYNWIDEDVDYIRKKLEYLDSREYTPMGCSKLKANGYCVSEVYCRYRNNIEQDMKDVGIL